ncbi:MAG TPA: MarR family transcriptional regulator [Croceibacterium sp.]|nr:MarR family transcriptional regulator [Croceibacterium sp.]
MNWVAPAARPLVAPLAHVPSQDAPGGLLQQLYTLFEAARGAAERDVLRSYKLDMRAWLVLRAIGKFESATQRQIAAATGLDKVAVNRAASSLKELRLTEALPNARDGRSHLLELSFAGEQTLASCAHDIATLESDLLDGLGEIECRDLVRLLKHLERSLAYRF